LPELLSEQFAEVYIFSGELFLIVVTVLPDGLVGWLLPQRYPTGGTPQADSYHPSLEENPEVQRERQKMETEDLTVSFDGFKALNQLNFSMDVGELRVVIGPNGAGKTTFLDVITGKVQPTRCCLRRNVRSLSEHQIARLGNRSQVPNPGSTSTNAP